MPNQKNIVLRKMIDGLLYDLMTRTVTDQVYNADGTDLTTLLTNLRTDVDAKATSADLDDLELRFTTLIGGAPEAYDTLLEIADYINTHKEEYDALLAISGDKVDKVDGMGLSANDFTDELKAKLDALYDQVALEEKFTDIEDRLAAVERATAVVVDAADVTYTSGDEVITVAEALDELLYKDLVITLGLNVATTQEIGASLTGVTATWSYSKAKVASQSMNGVAITDVTVRSYTDPATVTANKTYTLRANDGIKDFSRSATISFQRKVYWGVSAVSDASAIDSAFILGLASSKFASAKTAVGTITANAAAGQYIYYAQQAGWADPTFNIGGFDTTFEHFATIDFTNASGNTTSYKVFKSGQAGLGSTSMTVK